MSYEESVPGSERALLAVGNLTLPFSPYQYKVTNFSMIGFFRASRCPGCDFKLSNKYREMPGNSHSTTVRLIVT